MAKRRFMTPVLLSGGLTPGSDGEDPIIGPGSGQTGFEPYPCDYEEWLSVFADGFDLNEDGNPDEYDDYVIWMQNNGWGAYIDPPLPDGE